MPPLHPSRVPRTTISLCAAAAAQRCLCERSTHSNSALREHCIKYHRSLLSFLKAGFGLGELRGCTQQLYNTCRWIFICLFLGGSPGVLPAPATNPSFKLFSIGFFHPGRTQLLSPKTTGVRLKLFCQTIQIELGSFLMTSSRSCYTATKIVLILQEYLTHPSK